MSHTLKNKQHVKHSHTNHQSYTTSGFHLSSIQIPLQTWKQTTLTLLVILFLLSSCHKQDVPKSELRLKQEAIAKELGFNPNNVSDVIPDKKNSLVFNSIEEAKAYFKLMNGNPPIVITEENKSITSYSTVQSVLRSNNISSIELTPKTFSDPESDFYEDSIMPYTGGAQIQYHPCTMQRWFVINGFRVDFKYKISDNGLLNVKDFRSELIGITMGLDYKQTSIEFDSFPRTNMIYFTLTGTKDYSIFVNGLGTFTHGFLTIKGTFNTVTGEKHMTYYEELDNGHNDK